MAQKTLGCRIKQKYDIATNWTSNNPVLLAGEIGIESDTNKIKIGDGTTSWNDLSYFGSNGGDISEELQKVINNETVIANSNGGFSGGKQSQCGAGGAIGYASSAITGGAVGFSAESQAGGFAGGYDSYSANGGGAVGSSASSQSGGGAIGHSSVSFAGGAVGNHAETNDGGSVGLNALSGDGFAGGRNAKTTNTTFGVIDAIQLGTGTNSKEKSLQIYNDNIYDSVTHKLTVQNIELDGVDIKSLIPNTDNFALKTEIPTNNNQLINGAGYITNSALANYLPLTGGTLSGNLTLNKELVFSNTSNPFIKMTTGGTAFYFQSTGGQFGLGPTWDYATKWDGSGKVTVPAQITSTVADGTAPFIVTSKTKVTNLNADLLDNHNSTSSMTATSTSIPTCKAIASFLGKANYLGVINRGGTLALSAGLNSYRYICIITRFNDAWGASFMVPVALALEYPINSTLILQNSTEADYCNFQFDNNNIKNEGMSRNGNSYAYGIN